jgi:hypothetical protein
VSGEEKVSGVSDEKEDEPPIGVEEEPSPTSPSSHVSQRREEERCGGD